jgi:hypothetical protein
VSLALRQNSSELPKPAWTSDRASVATENDHGRWRQERDGPVAEQIAFLAKYGVSRALLEGATSVAAATGVSAEQALFGEGLMREEEFYRLLARQLDAPYFCGELEMAPCADPAMAATREIARLAPNVRRLRYVVAPRGQMLIKLLALDAAGRLQPSFVVTSPQRLNSIFRAQMGHGIADDAAGALQRTDATLSARSGLSKGQLVCVGLLTVSAIVLGFLQPESLAVLSAVGLWIAFASSVGLRFAAMTAAVSACTSEPLDDRELPVYSIIAPLFREEKILAPLIQSLDAIDYPRSKLDIKIVVEQNDLETLLALARMRLPSRYEIIVAPRGAPSTKPRALNIALPSVRGEFTVIYDAEDAPACDQLRRAATRFAGDKSIDCLQARLTIDNIDDSWLTKLFAIEYGALFDVIGPGLAALGAPLPLGGTSNHFRTSAPWRTGGWDAWNVTEDADLGLRLARFGHRVAALDSDTYEEAPSRLAAWLRQRRRWQKGWLQTLIVHTRCPRRLCRELGFARAAAGVILALGAVLGGMLGPALSIGALWRCWNGELFAARTPFGVAGDAMTLLLLLAGSQAMLIPIMLSIHDRKLRRLYRYLPLLPLYYCLVSIAAWAALIDLALKPHHWSKTEHGLARTSVRASSHIGERANHS